MAQGIKSKRDSIAVSVNGGGSSSSNSSSSNNSDDSFPSCCLLLWLSLFAAAGFCLFSFGLYCSCTVSGEHDNVHSRTEEEGEYNYMQVHVSVFLKKKWTRNFLYFPILKMIQNMAENIFSNGGRRYISTTIFATRKNFEFENILKKGAKL